MDKKELERIKGLSREERVEFFNKNKNEILALNADDLAAVNGGFLWWNDDDSAYKPKPHENPDTDCPYRDCYYSSFGFICDGEVIC